VFPESGNDGALTLTETDPANANETIPPVLR
jgi:hypothetical protein